jgi:DAK2 domain fusion protein YloV
MARFRRESSRTTSLTAVDTRDDAVATFDLPTVVRFSHVALEALGLAREEIDALNVYPVPDGDTGTNLFLTLEAARTAMLERLQQDPPGDLRDALAAYARGALLGARGNSGVIMSQLVGALLKRIAEAGPGDRSAVVFAEGLARATDASYAAVGEPVEGTILTVARAASDAALRASEVPENRLGHVVRAAAAAAREALARTPDQLATLRDAGVVDAGGRGLCVVLDAAETAVTGRHRADVHAALGVQAIPVPLPTGDLHAEGPAYEVMYLLEAADETVPALRRTLGPLGDSLVVVGGDGLWNVHVHVDDVGAAVEAGIEAGRPYRIRVTHFAEQLARRTAGSRRGTGRRGRKVVVVAAGEGLERLFGDAGAVVVPGAGSRPSTGQLLEVIASCGAAEVVVLPNDRDLITVAEAAARAARDEGDLRVAVIPTSAQVQGLAALAVHEPGRSFEEDLLQMTSAARHTRSGAVTVAARQAITTAGPCEPGDVLGVVEGDFAVVGQDLYDVAVDVLERLLGGGGEMVTVVSGAGGAGLADRCVAHLTTAHPTVDAVVYDGGQERYPLLLGVE